MASAVDSRLAYARPSAVATASRLPTANRGSNNSYTTSGDTTLCRRTGAKKGDSEATEVHRAMRSSPGVVRSVHHRFAIIEANSGTYGPTRRKSICEAYIICKINESIW